MSSSTSTSTDFEDFEAFDEAVLKICVAKMCTRLGFDSIEAQSLEILVDVVKRRIRDVGL